MKEWFKRLEPYQIWNFDETLCSLRKTRQNNIVVPAEYCRVIRGVEQDTLRVGIGVCLSAAGAVGPLVVCHKAELPRGIKADDMKKCEEVLEFTYRQTPDGWIKTDAMVTWFARFLHTLRSACQQRNGKQEGLLLLDNAPFHVTFILELWREQSVKAGFVTDAPVRIQLAAEWLKGRLESTCRRYRAVLPSLTDAERIVAFNAGLYGANVTVGFLTVAIRFLPFRTTSLIQPADQGFLAQLLTKFDTKKWRYRMQNKQATIGEAIKDLAGTHLTMVGQTETNKKYWRRLRNEVVF